MTKDPGEPYFRDTVITDEMTANFFFVKTSQGLHFNRRQLHHSFAKLFAGAVIFSFYTIFIDDSLVIIYKLVFKEHLTP